MGGFWRCGLGRMGLAPWGWEVAPGVGWPGGWVRRVGGWRGWGWGQAKPAQDRAQRAAGAGSGGQEGGDRRVGQEGTEVRGDGRGGVGQG